MRQMVSLNYNARSMLEEDGVADYEAGKGTCTGKDRRLLFSEDCAGAFALPSIHGVQRNIRLVQGPINHLAGVIGPGGWADVAKMFLAKM